MNAPFLPDTLAALMEMARQHTAQGRLFKKYF